MFASKWFRCPTVSSPPVLFGVFLLGAALFFGKRRRWAGVILSSPASRRPKAAPATRSEAVPSRGQRLVRSQRQEAVPSKQQEGVPS